MKGTMFLPDQSEPTNAVAEWVRPEVSDPMHNLTTENGSRVELRPGSHALENTFDADDPTARSM